jgi:hypothetical protein
MNKRIAAEDVGDVRCICYGDMMADGRIRKCILQLAVLHQPLIARYGRMLTAGSVMSMVNSEAE